ncbi:MAG: molybdate ABC transporter substrate-binding protein [Thermodesulfobacteriota bacterium]
MLNWPEERVTKNNSSIYFNSVHNRILDFHGDPVSADLIIFSDGNHHMALNESLNLFKNKFEDEIHIFYATTPPKPLVDIINSGKILCGNMEISVKPDIFISPEKIIKNLEAKNLVKKYEPFMASRCNALLIRKKDIGTIKSLKDAVNKKMNIFISNPKRENASYSEYLESIYKESDDNNELPDFVYGESIHHREAPEAVFSGKADCAVVYYHLALRYKRIFPDIFDFIKLGVKGSPKISHIAMMNNSGKFSNEAYNFLNSEEVSKIYNKHGIDHYSFCPT